ncbi:MAG TPA: hypothetical protein VM938_10680 [Acidimicrobiales bacterium]|nr:hypothetical protein [Acidimicrobiales bacterium]
MSSAEEIAQQAQVSIARIDATLVAIKQQQDHAGRTVEQLVRLVEERLSAKFDAFGARFDTLERRLDDMEASRAAARVEQAAEFRALDLRIDQAKVDQAAEFRALDLRLDADFKALDARIENVERWRDKVTNRGWGLAAGMTLAGGGVGAALATLTTRLTA